MKIQKLVLGFILSSFATLAMAHCPASYKEEKVCFMLDKNMLYIWDHKFEHNGPYKDFDKADLTGIKSAAGSDLPYKKVARGIYKIESTDMQKSVTLVATLNKKKTEIKIAHE